MKLLLLGMALSASVARAEMVLDVKAIAGKTQAEVASQIGQPVACEKSKYGQRCSYKKAETEIVFIKGRADWITVEGIDDLSFNGAVLQALGLKARKPSVRTESVLRWTDIEGLLEVSVFKGAAMADYAYVKVATD